MEPRGRSPGRADTVATFHRSRRGRPLGRHRGAASEVIGTLLILAITVALFAAVMLFVSQAQPPSTPPQSQFLATLATNSTNITSISIQLVAGQAISGGSTAQAYVHLASKAKPTAITPAQFTLPSGLSGATLWHPGGVWTVSLASAHLPKTDNVSITIVAGGHLLFQKILPGPAAVVAPFITSVWTFPSPLTHGKGYSLYATISIPDGLGSGSVKVNLSKVTGLPASPQSMTLDPTTGVWGYSNATGPTTAGTYTAYLTVVDSQNQRAYLAFQIQVV